MKKLLTLCLIALIALCDIAAVPRDHTKSFRLQGGYDETIAVSVTGIAALEMQGLVGMPFDIQDKSVLSSNKGDGREIAKWSMISNTPFNIIVKAISMHNISLVEGQWNDDNSLEYQMVMSYKLVYDDDGSAVTKVANLFFDTEKDISIPSDFQGEQVGNNSVFKFDIFNDLSISQNDKFVGSLDGSIYFKFTDSSTIKVFDDALIPPGNYSATVTITLETKE